MLIATDVTCCQVIFIVTMDTQITVKCLKDSFSQIGVLFFQKGLYHF